MLGVRFTMILAVVVFLVTSAAWWYFSTKKVLEIRADYDKRMEGLLAQHREDLEALSALSQGMQAMKDGFEALDKDRRYTSKKLEELRKKDEAARNYLAQPVPDGVQSLAKGSHCLQVPGSCDPDKTDDKRDPAYPFD